MTKTSALPSVAGNVSDSTAVRVRYLQLIGDSPHASLPRRVLIFSEPACRQQPSVSRVTREPDPGSEVADSNPAAHGWIVDRRRLAEIDRISICASR
jgi:hypothetical protein